MMAASRCRLWEGQQAQGMSDAGEHAPLIFLNSVGMYSSSNGRRPHSITYRITPQLQMSISGPA